ncbi:MAG: molybdenum cofactor carrier protein [Candidatus Nitrohelix vancouverensis]|uniref:Molybdenum cofactor carrier protein n=1 Tax=Candidatus Nitrohelix vancouverensis TaxID=2705534 RepID=A0A7T0C400_9BACT|nr:MAG: molybdenum cofactor carrier protein [Candidatus Nitrohelix vancouverensis]
MPEPERAPEKSIAVIGSGSEPHLALTIPLGKLIADSGFHLISGGGAGSMRAVSESFVSQAQRMGKCIGILPSSADCNTPEKRSLYCPPQNYPNDCIEICIRTHLPLSGAHGKETASRNHLVVLSADKIIALPGSEGTRCEIELALEYKKELLLLDPDGIWSDYYDLADHTSAMEQVAEWLGA